MFSLQKSTRPVVIVTGGNAGIGRECVWLLMQRNVPVYFTCRSQEKVDAAHAELMARWREHVAKADAKAGKHRAAENASKEPVKERPAPTLEGFVIELTDIQTINAFAAEMKRRGTVIGCLLNNAGVIPYAYKKSASGLEQTLHSNYVGPYLLTLGLLPQLVDSAKKVAAAAKNGDSSNPSDHRMDWCGATRIVNVASKAHTYTISHLRKLVLAEDGWTQVNSPDHFDGNFATYGSSKLFNIWFTQALQAYINRTYGADFPLYVAALHPGVIKSDLWRNYPGWIQSVASFLGAPFLLSARQGASGLLYLSATNDPLARGAYYTRYGDPKSEDDLGKAKAETPNALGRDIEARNAWMKKTQAWISQQRYTTSGGDYQIPLYDEQTQQQPSASKA